MLRAEPLLVQGKSGQYTISSQANTIGIAGNTVFQYFTGTDFSKTEPTDDLVLTPSQAKLVASRSTRYSIRVYLSVFGILSPGFGGLGIDLNGDTIGGNIATSFGNISVGFNVVDGITIGYCVASCERIFDSLAATDEIRPVFGFITTAGTPSADTPTVDQFIMIATPLGE